MIQGEGELAGNTCTLKIVSNPIRYPLYRPRDVLP
jgi:hypothetical protein